MFKHILLSGTSIPAKQKALFWLDGRFMLIGSDYYFIDRLGNRNFLITGFDFEIANGFPYKSAATISAPAGDATLIAADVNNFLYDSGGSPNQIPVISLFQNVDYENKLFCKHIAQVVDGNGVETSEPYVKDIVLYNAALTGAELATANSYYGVPVEVTANVLWVSKTGNDSTGDGSKANPYLTVTKFISVGNGKTCYVKTGMYNEVLSFNGKNQTIIGVGLNYLSSTTSGTIQYAGAASNTVIKGFLALETLANKILIQCANTALVFDKLKLTGGTNDVRHTTGVSPVTITNSFLTKIQERLSDTTYDACIFKPLINQSTLFQAKGCKLSILRSKITENTSTGLVQVSAILSEIYMLGCDFYGNTYVDQVNAYAPKISILSCKINLKTTSILSYINNTESRVINVNNNIINSVGSQNNLVNLIGKGTSKFNDNIIIGQSRDFTVNIKGKDTLSTLECLGNKSSSKSFIATVWDGNCTVQNNIFDSSDFSQIDVSVSISSLSVIANVINNTLITKITEKALILIGTENESVSYGMLNGSIVANNKLLTLRYYDQTPVAQHGVFIYSQSVVAKFNLLNGAMLGYVMKSAGETYASVIHHNIVIDTDNPFLSKGAPNVSYYNNTAILKKQVETPIFLVLMKDVEIGNNTFSINTKFKNNICVDFNAGNATVFVQATTGDLVGAEIDYNIYYKANPGTLFAYVDGVAKTFAEWQALGYDTHSVLLTPLQAANLFVDHINGNYSLKTGSSAIGAGVDLGTDYDDGLDVSTFWGDDTQLPIVVTKQQGEAWDCGAYVS